MAIEDEYIRLIFGLKLKQIRTEKNLSLFGLAKLTGLSKSYLNEIEKGKKYPKTDKIVILSEKLEVQYDYLVSLKLDKNLAPIGEILQSKILKEIPLDLFGLKENVLINIVSNAPAKVNAFISTIIKISQNYNLTRESFFLASLRSYQEAHNNYFEDIENDVEKFAESYHIDLSKRITSKDLEEILIEEFNYKINTIELAKHRNLEELRNIYIPTKKILLIDENISEAQKTFIYAKEIAYNFLNIEERLYTFPWIKFENFDQVLTSVRYSYAQTATLEFEELFDGVRVFENPKSFRDLSLLTGYLSGPDDIVMDFFAGSGSTAHGVLHQNAGFGGNRTWITVQIGEAVGQGSAAANFGFATIADITKERIRRAGAKILEEKCHPDWNRDVGFRVLKIDSSNMADVYYTPDATTQADLLTRVDNIKPDRSPEDLLFQVLLDWGVDLTLPIIREVLDGKTVFTVAGSALIACFDNSVDETLVKTLAARKPLRVVFKDTGFKDDATKINVKQIFKSLSPDTEVKAI